MLCFEVTETWDLLHFSELKKMIKEKYEQTNKETNKIIKKKSRSKQNVMAPIFQSFSHM